MKPRIWKSYDHWYCGVSYAPVSPEPWGSGKTPLEAYTMWKKENHVA